MKNDLMWVSGILRQYKGRVWGTILGIALTVSLFISLGSFISSSNAVMVKSAVKDIPVDWQILVPHSSDRQKVTEALQQTVPFTAMSEVQYADANGFLATKDGTTQTTGPGKVVGLSENFLKNYPSQLRTLVGSLNGVLIAQQTSSNLHATVGDVVSIKRVGLPPVKVKISGVVDLPNADSFFQAVGVPASAAPQAPPDNVLLMPMSKWQQIFNQQLMANPASIQTELHVNISHQKLPDSPTKAYVYVQQVANHAEALMSGSGKIGDNLASRLGGVRADALYAKVLFLFLGIPGAILAGLLTISVANSGAQRRREQQALLRTRGASVSQILKFVTIEALVTGMIGVVMGLVLSLLTTKFLTGFALTFNTQNLTWIGISSIIGLCLALFSILIPAWRDVRNRSVDDAKTVYRHSKIPIWRVIYLDLILIVIAGISFWNSTSSGYQLVLAPDGVAKTSVHYEAFIAPLCLWVGGTLLFMRLLSIVLDKGRSGLGYLFKPLAGHLSQTVSRSMSRQRKLIVQGIVLVVLAFSFATSTAVFNTTFNAQSIVNAQLTNGSDVTVSGSTAANPGKLISQLKQIQGVAKAEPMQHRFAYVGNDLQDIFGINPKSISQVTNLSNAYFVKDTAKEAMKKLENTHDGIFVSVETALDYQLNLGDQITLRLKGKDHQYHPVPFQFIGIVNKFPTAPKDSFFVANADYITQQTGVNAYETVLMKTNQPPNKIATQARDIVKNLPGVKVTEINSAQQTISSSLTSVNLHGLTRLELVFAIIFIAAAAGLVLGLGMNERSRLYSILTALGAKQNQLGAFLWSEGIFIIASGSLIGLGFGFVISELLVKVLKGVFDPPPQFLHVPWTYIALLIIIGMLSMIIVIVAMIRHSFKNISQSLRNL